MTRPSVFLAASLLAGAVLLLPTASAQAQRYRGGYYHVSSYHPIMPVMNPHHMPGWDWWRIYPWSPYNYGRNPYNPTILPYPVYYGGYPSPVYSPLAPTGYMAGYSGVPPLVQSPTVQPTAGPAIAPPDAALVVVRLPDPSAQVLFNGERTYTQGLSVREFTTPELAAGKTYTYTVTATWTRDGRPVTQERQVRVSRGQVSTVDFTRPAAGN
jgi:uncharacterized protein (TIGR03000 family)